MTQAELEALLGRPLTTVEVTNLPRTLKSQRKPSRGCYVAPSVVSPKHERSTFGTVTVLPLLTCLLRTSVSLNGVALVAMHTRNDSGTSDRVVGITPSYLTLYTARITVTADWGFDCSLIYNMPTGLAEAIANAFAEVSKKNKSQRRLVSPASK